MRLVIVTGMSGAGKSTALKMLEDMGYFCVDNLPIPLLMRFVELFGGQEGVKGLTVRNLLELAHGGKLSEDKYCTILGRVGLCTKDYIDREVNASLSGGEIKRIEIATVLARTNTKLSVFDEPEAGIDLWSFSGLIDAFKELKEKTNNSLLIISHQERILEIADEIVVIANGKVRTRGTKEEVLPELLADEKAMQCPKGKHVYTA